MRNVFLICVYVALFASCAKVGKGDAKSVDKRASETSSRQIYAATLDSIANKALNDSDDCSEQDGWNWIAEEKNRIKSESDAYIGYAIIDFNNDGKDELLAGFAGKDVTHIDVIYVYDGEKVRKLVESYNRHSCTINTDGSVLLNRYCGGSEEYYELYTLEHATLIPKRIVFTKSAEGNGETVLVDMSFNENGCSETVVKSGNVGIDVDAFSDITPQDIKLTPIEQYKKR